jgi:hypothetical protein
MINDTDFQKFQQAIDGWLSCFQNIDIVYMAEKSGGKNFLRYCRAILNPGTQNTIGQFLHESESLICGSISIDYSADWLQSICNSIRNCPITLDNKCFKFVLKDNQMERYSFFYQHDTLGMLGDPLRMPIRMPILKILGGDFGGHLPMVGSDVLDWELRSAEPPYDDMHELLTVVDIPRNVYDFASPVIEVHALPPVLIADNSSMTGGKTHAQILASGKADLSKISLSYKLIKNGQPIRKSASMVDCTWTQQSKRQEGSLSIDAEDGEIVHLFLKYNKAAIHHRWLWDPTKYLNPYLAVYECFDNESTTLRKMVLHPGNASDDFEAGVALLLNILGFGTSHFGIIKKLQNGPDIVAVIPDGNALLMIECTTGLINNKDKLAKLVQRTQALKEKLTQTGYHGIEVYPVIISSLPHEQLAADINKAQKLQVSVVAREELEQWFERRTSALNPKETLRQILALVPPAQARENILHTVITPVSV